MAEDLAATRGGLFDGPSPLAAAQVARRTFHAGLGLCALAGLALGAATIAREPLWNDEIATIAVVERPLSEFLAQLPDRQNGMLFDIVLWPLVQLFGPSAAVARLPALLAVALAVVVCGLVGARLGGRMVGLLAAALLALHPAVVYYAQEARPYGFVVLFAVVSAWTLLRALDRPSVGRWIAYVLSLAALVYSHDFAILILLAHPFLVLGHPNRAARRGFMLALGIPALLVIPLLVFIPADWGQSALYWVPDPSLDQIRATSGLLAGRQGFAIPIALVLAWALISPTARQRAADVVESVPRVYAFLGIWLIAPIAVLYLVSQFTPVLVPRYTIASVPALCLALALALALLRPRYALILAALFAAAFLVRSIDDDVELSKTDWPAAASYLESSAAPGDSIVVVGDALHHANALFYYGPGLGVSRDHLLWTREDRERLPDRFVLVGGGGSGEELLDVPRRSENAWVVLSNFVSNDVQADLDRLFAACESTRTQEFRLVDVVHLTGCSPPG
jgi:mannosyltransferase